MNSPAPVNIATLRKLITLNPKQKNICTVCHKKMRAPGADEEPTPTCDNCAQDIIVEVLPKLLNEIEAARATKPVAAKPAPKLAKPVAVKASKPTKKATKKVAKAKKLEEKPKRGKPNLRVVPKQPESAPEVEPERPSKPESEPEPEPEPERESEPEVARESEPEAIDTATDVSELALALDEEKKEETPRRRRIVKFVPATPQEVHAAAVKLRERFEN